MTKLITVQLTETQIRECLNALVANTGHYHDLIKCEVVGARATLRTARTAARRLKKALAKGQP